MSDANAPRPPDPAPPAPSWWRNVRTIRDMPGQTERFLLAVLCLGVIFVAWLAVTWGPPESRIIDAYTLPSPGETLRSFHSLWFERALARSAFWSLGRVLAGFLTAASIAVPMGVLAASYPRVQAFLNPVSIFGRNVPVAALIPLTLIWFGLGETQKIMFIFFASVAFIFFDSTNATHAVSGNFLDTAYTLGARRVPREGLRKALVIGLVYGAVLAAAMVLVAGENTPGAASLLGGALTGFAVGALVWYPITSHQVISKVLFPLALPGIVNSLRLLFGLAFGYIMLAEVINAEHGLGNIIIVSQRRGPREHIYLSLVIISILAFGIDRLVLSLQRRWFPYQTEGK
ncbi:MAG: ABC transporter permease subunit [Kiritimatiellia bacterium]